MNRPGGGGSISVFVGVVAKTQPHFQYTLFEYVVNAHKSFRVCRVSALLMSSGGIADRVAGDFENVIAAAKDTVGECA
jgi:hypothetical protein